MYMLIGSLLFILLKSKKESFYYNALIIYVGTPCKVTLNTEVRLYYLDCKYCYRILLYD